MKKEIRLIAIAFKVNGKIGVILIEEYLDYPNTLSRLKLWHLDSYYEQIVEHKYCMDARLVFDNFFIEKNCIFGKIKDMSFRYEVDNTNLIADYRKNSNAKPLAKTYFAGTCQAMINDQSVTAFCSIDLEIIFSIPDAYYKLINIDFKEFSGYFALSATDCKVNNLYLNYKDQIISNKRTLNIHCHQFKRLNYKFRFSGKYAYKVWFKSDKTVKCETAMLPFRFHMGSLRLKFKKYLFKTNLDADSQQAILICFEFS